MLFKSVLVIAVIAFSACYCNALPVEKELQREVVPIVKSEFSKNDEGSYHSAYESGDGTSRSEDAAVVAVGTEDEALEVKGSYKYINDEGYEVEVFYTAGVNGFVPYGTHINPEITAVAQAAKDLPKDEPEEKHH